MSMIEAKLNEMGLTLPPAPAPSGTYVRSVRVGNLVFQAGGSGRAEDGSYITGKLGRDTTVEEGYRAARATGLTLLSNLKQEIGDLDKVTRIVKVFGMVNSDPEFKDPPAVINGCSDLLVELFGERGKHARSAVGMASLPFGVAVEIEMVVEVAE